MKKLIDKLFNTRVSTSYMFILFGISALMLAGYFSYAWFTVQGVQQYSVVTGTLNGAVAIGSNLVTINGSGVITYTPSTDNDTITLTVTNTNDRTIKNSIYYYTLSDSSIEIGYTSDSPTIPSKTGVSVEASKTLTYKIKIKGANGKQIKIGFSMGLSNSNLTLPSGTTAFSLLSDPPATETLVAKANPEDLDYNTATDDQKNQMWTFSHEETEQLGATTDYRYIGANPNNYVKFNDELWRIIGIFDVDDGTGKVEKRMKIIRNESIGDYAWDSNNVNEWSTATLNTLLNTGTYYTGLTYSAKEMIDDVKWYLGGTADYNYASNGLASHWYKYERGTKVYSGRSTNWTGKVGLIYPSDYGYATGGGSNENRTSCAAKEMLNWKGSTYRDCIDNDWLFKSESMWFLTHYVSYYREAFNISYNGYLGYNNASYLGIGVFPTVYLKSTIKVTSGTGSSTSPFILSE